MPISTGGSSDYSRITDLKIPLATTQRQDGCPGSFCPTPPPQLQKDLSPDKRGPAKDDRTKSKVCRLSRLMHYQVGQQVWLSTKDVQLKDTPHKLDLHLIGPFTLGRVINPSAVHLILPTSMRIHPTFHISQVNPVKTSPLGPPTNPPPHPVAISHTLRNSTSGQTFFFSKLAPYKCQ